MTLLPESAPVRPRVSDVLKSWFGHDSFLPMQEDVIRNVLCGRDSLVLMPTGSGKSLCYQLPALCIEGLTLVVSPLIALMKDQVDALKRRGVAASFINSTMTSADVRRVQLEAHRGRLDILYVAPERIALPRFRDFLHAVKLGLIAIDEAHCISEWGHDFRPDYRNLQALRADFPDVPLIALTATATERVRQDIADQLRMPEATRFVASFNRPNLTYVVRPKRRSFDALVDLLRKRPDGSAIVYRFSRRNTEELAADLSALGFRALPYHAGLENDVRRETQERFLSDEVPIVVATIAFGMGVDKPNVRLVVHYDLPKTVESYYQETGRAGRDGLPSDCVLFYSYGDKVNQDYFIQQIEDDAERKNAEAKLAKMVEYGEAKSCRRAFLLRYFGEECQEENCGTCDVCLAKSERPDAASTYDGTEIARNALSAVMQTGQRFGVNHVVDVLRGSRAKRVIQFGHDELRGVHGSVRGMAADDLKDAIDQLIDKGFVARRTDREYPTLYVTDKGRDLLNGRETVVLTMRSPPRAENTVRANSSEYQKRVTTLLAHVMNGPVSLTAGPSDESLRNQVEGVLGTLRDREADVLRFRFGLRNGRTMTLEEIGKVFGVTRERIRQIETMALRRLRARSRLQELTGLIEATDLSAADMVLPLSPKPGTHQVRQSHPRAYERWLPEEGQRLVSLFESGRSIPEIASELGRQPSAIRSRLLRAGFIPNDGRTYIQAEDSSHDLQTGRQAHPDYFEPYVRTLDMVREGLSVVEIAKRRGIPTRVVLTHLERLTDKGESFDITRLLPPESHYALIADAVRAANSPHVTAVLKWLGDGYSAEEIRLVRLHMRQVERDD